MYGRGYPPMQHDYFARGGDGHPLAWILFFILLAILVGFVAAFVFRWLAARRVDSLRPALAGAPAGDVLSVVRMRYARGEIDREQFLLATADLAGPQPPPPPADAPTAH